MNYIERTPDQVRKQSPLTAQEMLDGIRDEYVLLDEQHPGTLQDKTNAALAFGWTLVGGLQAFSCQGYPHYCQSLQRTAEAQRNACTAASSAVLALTASDPIDVVFAALRASSHPANRLIHEMRQQIATQLGELGQHPNQDFGFALLQAHLRERFSFNL